MSIMWILTFTTMINGFEVTDRHAFKTKEACVYALNTMKSVYPEGKGTCKVDASI